MIKLDEIYSPLSCLNRAADDEPVFVLRANDPAAADTIRWWATRAYGIHELEKRRDAMECANQMEIWRDQRFGQ